MPRTTHAAIAVALVLSACSELSSQPAPDTIDTTPEDLCAVACPSPITPEAPAEWCAMEVDVSADGAVDSYVFQVLDGSGRVIEMDEDRDADGTIDAATTFEYDAQGRLIARSYWDYTTPANTASPATRQDRLFYECGE